MNGLTIRARSIARCLGLKRIYYRFVHYSSNEEKVKAAVAKHLKINDVVWDVGANCGDYATLFSKLTGPGGHVFAFEPVPRTFAELCSKTAECPWVHNEQIALSDFDGVGRMIVSESSSVTSHLQRSMSETTAANTVEVSIMRGDSFWASSGMTPNAIKIDVEGFEEEVLDGMRELLSAAQLRVVLIEIHMQILDERGRARAPIRIEKLLRSKGLRPRWIDPSHLCADREGAVVPSR